MDGCLDFRGFAARHLAGTNPEAYLQGVGKSELLPVQKPARRSRKLTQAPAVEILPSSAVPQEILRLDYL